MTLRVVAVGPLATIQDPGRHRNTGAFIDQANVLARLSALVRTAIGQG